MELREKIVPNGPDQKTPGESLQDKADGKPNAYSSGDDLERQLIDYLVVRI